MKESSPDARIIFISYRREDSSERAHRLHDSLRAHFGRDKVFIDLDVPLGVDVRKYITQKLSSCAVLLAVIGPHWLTSRDEEGTRRLDSELDYVRLEIATALNSESTVVPMLVNGATMPIAGQLPPEIAKLADRNGLDLLDGQHWHTDVGRLIAAIEPILAESKPASLLTAAATPGGGPPPRAPARWSPSWDAFAQRRFLYVGLATAVAAIIAGVIAVTQLDDQQLRIYSSLRERAQQQPRGTTASDLDRGLRVVPFERTTDMENAMRLALAEAGGKAGRFDVTYEPLDSSDANGESPTALVQANARRVAEDDDTAVYIGDLDSGATQESIKILSRAKIPQISMSSTRVGLTMNDPSGDVNEPDRYYPNDYHQFVRIVPPDSVQAKALLEVMQSDGCHYSVMIDDNTPYGEALASNILAEKRRVKFAVSDSVGPLERYGRLLRRARREHPDCFVYCGNRNANTVEMFEKFARFVPRLYGTDALVDKSFYDADERGLRADVARKVTLMVPPYERNNAYRRFEDHFREIYHKTPDAYVAYAYEAMRLALQAIAESGSGKREDIVTKLKSATRVAEDSVLGRYRITTTGDTDVEDYAVSRIEGNRLRPRER